MDQRRQILSFGLALVSLLGIGLGTELLSPLPNGPGFYSGRPPPPVHPLTRLRRMLARVFPFPGE